VTKNIVAQSWDFTKMQKFPKASDPIEKVCKKGQGQVGAPRKHLRALRESRIDRARHKKDGLNSLNIERCEHHRQPRKMRKITNGAPLLTSVEHLCKKSEKPYDVRGCGTFVKM
jgi:hypothetical protein